MHEEYYINGTFEDFLRNPGEEGWHYDSFGSFLSDVRMQTGNPDEFLGTLLDTYAYYIQCRYPEVYDYFNDLTAGADLQEMYIETYGCSINEYEDPAHVYEFLDGYYWPCFEVYCHAFGEPSDSPAATAYTAVPQVPQESPVMQTAVPASPSALDAGTLSREMEKTNSLLSMIFFALLFFWIERKAKNIVKGMTDNGRTG